MTRQSASATRAIADSALQGCALPEARSASGDLREDTRFRSPIQACRGGLAEDVTPDRDESGEFIRGPLANVGVYEQPLVAPHEMHLRQVPLRTMVNWPHSVQGSPS